MPKPLQGVKVIELGTLIAGPFCTRILAEFGCRRLDDECAGRAERCIRRVARDDRPAAIGQHRLAGYSGKRLYDLKSGLRRLSLIQYPIA